jgi:DNA (cytosine-5)-methyltransferase 1
MSKSELEEVKRPMRFGSLFTGIGGIDLGLERAGMECAWQVENDPYCIKVLEKHWPNTWRYEDVKQIHGLVAHPNSQWSQPSARKTVSGGQDTKTPYSQSGSGSGAGPALCTTGERAECSDCLPTVDLLAGGFPCQPHSVAGRRRGAEDDRNLWPEYLRLIRETRPRYVIAENVLGIVSTYIDTVLSDLEGESYTCWAFNIPACAFDAPHRRERIFIVANADGTGRQEWEKQTAKTVQRINTNYRETGTHWTTEPDVGRVAHGVPRRIHRLRGLGNAVVPQVAEWIAQRIMEHSNE